MREMGIALSTAISPWLNALLLYIILNMRNNITLDSRMISRCFKTIICSIVMGIVCYFLYLILFPHMTINSIVINVGALVLAIMVCKIIYIVMIFVLKVFTINELKGYITK